VAPIANFAESTGEETTDEQILVVDAGRKDYQLKGTLTVQAQKFR
jgi:hypothetical protein